MLVGAASGTFATEGPAEESMGADDPPPQAASSKHMSTMSSPSVGGLILSLSLHVQT
jgi:hypothetical protein